MKRKKNEKESNQNKQARKLPYLIPWGIYGCWPYVAP